MDFAAGGTVAEKALFGLGEWQELIVQLGSPNSTPSFPRFLGGNPEQCSFVDSRQKHAGMTIWGLQRKFYFCHAPNSDNSSKEAALKNFPIRVNRQNATLRTHTQLAIAVCLQVLDKLIRCHLGLLENAAKRANCEFRMGTTHPISPSAVCLFSTM